MKRQNTKYNKQFVPQRKQPYIFCHFLQHEQVIFRCFLKKRKTYNKTPLSATERSFGSVQIKVGVLLLFFVFIF